MKRTRVPDYIFTLFLLLNFMPWIFLLLGFIVPLSKVAFFGALFNLAMYPAFLFAKYGPNVSAGESAWNPLYYVIFTPIVGALTLILLRFAIKFFWKDKSLLV